MKKWTFLFFLATIIYSCDNSEDPKPEERLIGNWEHEYNVIGSERTLSLPGVAYTFKADNTYIKTLDSFNWRDEGTWAYDEDTQTLSFNYKTYSYQVSNWKSLNLKVEKLTDRELILKADYNDTNHFGQFVESEFIHYIKK